MLHDSKHGDHVDLEGRLDVGEINLSQIHLEDLLSGVVDDDIDAVSVRGDVRVDDALDLRVTLDREVARDQVDLSALGERGGLDLLLDLVGAGGSREKVKRDRRSAPMNFQPSRRLGLNGWRD